MKLHLCALLEVCKIFSRSLYIYIYINDLITDINSTIRLFADDCLIYRVTNSSADHQLLQQDLNALSNWATKWQMKFNMNAVFCSYLNTSTKVYFHILLAGERLSTVDQHPYLGVQLDHHLSWRPQINYVCSKATRTLNFLHCNLQNCPKNLKELSYKQFVLPVLLLLFTILCRLHTEHERMHAHISYLAT